MPSEVVDGCTIPLRLSGDVALDFCNTRAGWGEPDPKEYLRDFRTFAVWAREAGVVGSAEFRGLELQGERARAALELAIDLRETVYAVLDPWVADPDAAQLAALRRRVEQAMLASDYRAVGDGRWELTGGTGPDLLVHRLALAAHQLLSLRGRPAVGRCAGRGCGWLFLNQGGRRRWCIMAICGNRAKARRRAARDAAPPAAVVAGETSALGEVHAGQPG